MRPLKATMFSTFLLIAIWFSGTLPCVEADQEEISMPSIPQSSPGSQEAILFPTVQGSNLEGQEFSLPDDFEGKPNLVFIAFLREQQDMVDTWLPTAKSLTEAYPGLRYYELPTIKRMNRVTRFFIDRGMRSGIPDKNTREVTITLYLDKEPFREALGILHEQTIQVLLVDDQGTVFWRTEGTQTEEKVNQLRTAIEGWVERKDSEMTLSQEEKEPTSATKTEVATIGGGCFWCLEPLFDALQGVISVESGYSGGTVPDPSYRQVSSGTTGHAEVIQITFDPSVVSFRDILEVFFAFHDPTTLNRQGADVGTQYRSAIFYHSAQQMETSVALIAELDKAGAWDGPIVTEVSPLTDFYHAEDYHQEYFARNPNQGYCRLVIAPKVLKFREKYRSRLKREAQ